LFSAVDSGWREGSLRWEIQTTQAQPKREKGERTVRKINEI
jgi:hypothetical protein